jgi:hypothetical protein
VLNQISHILKAIAALLLLAAGFFVIRSLIVPDSFGVQHSYTYGYYRAASDGEQASLPMLYQGSSPCLECHARASANWKAGKHAGVPCESCHGICRAGKNEAGEKPVANSSSEACLRCHAALRGRPASFPQVAGLDQHVQEKTKWGYQAFLVSVDTSKSVKDRGDVFALGVRCVLCHDAHHPLLKQKILP